MIRIAGVIINETKPLYVALTDIYGIGKSKAISVCRDIGVSEFSKIFDLSSENIDSLRSCISKFPVESDLRSLNASNIKRLMDIGCFRSVKHRKKSK